jgi:transposase InsO family protein
MGLEDQAHDAHGHPNQVAQELEDMILILRGRHTHWGPKKLRAHLQRRMGGIAWPSPSTIGGILHRHGLTVSRKTRRRTPPYTQPLSHCAGANEVWCTDFKGWFRTLDGDRCDPLTITDAFSRYLLRVQALERTDGESVWAVFEALFRENGVPGAIRSDNGSPFATRGIGGLSYLSVRWVRLGIRVERIEPGEPQQNGRHERMHLTLKQETAQPPQRTVRRQQEAFLRFQKEFNDERPHEALGQKCPGELYTHSPRTYPGCLPEVEYPPGMEVRNVKGNGVFNWRGQVVFLGEALSRQRVGLTELSEGCWGVYFCQQALGIVDVRCRKVVAAEDAVRKGIVTRELIRSPFRCAPGAPDEPGIV